MEDAPTGQLFRQDSLPGSAETEPAETEPADTDIGEMDTSPDVARQAAGRRTGGRRYSAGHPPHQRRRAYEQPPVQATPFRSGFGARGTLAGLFAFCLASSLLAVWLHVMVLAGLGFCVGCGLAASCCRPAALLRVVIAVPTVYVLADVLAQLATLQGGGRRGLALPVAGGTLLTLAAVAPWLFAGTAGAVTIALFRGLPQCVSDLRAALRGREPAQEARRAQRAQQAPRAQRAALSPQAQRAQQMLQALQATAPKARRTPPG